MGSPSSKAACYEKIAHLQSNIADDQVQLAAARASKNKASIEMLKGRIASTKAQIAELKAKAKTLK